MEARGGRHRAIWEPGFFLFGCRRQDDGKTSTKTGWSRSELVLYPLEKFLKKSFWPPGRWTLIGVRFNAFKLFLSPKRRRQGEKRALVSDAIGTKLSNWIRNFCGTRQKPDGKSRRVGKQIVWHQHRLVPFRYLSGFCAHKNHRLIVSLLFHQRSYVHILDVFQTVSHLTFAWHHWR